METEKIKINILRLAEYNPRTISKGKIKDLMKSIKEDPEFLEIRPIIVNTYKGRKNVVIAGNMRVLAAKELGWMEIPAILVSVDPLKEKQWNLKDNRNFGEWDEDKLAELLYELNKEGVDFNSLGFDEDEVRKELEKVMNTGEKGENGTSEISKCSCGPWPDNNGWTLDDFKRKAEAIKKCPIHKRDFIEITTFKK